MKKYFLIFLFFSRAHCCATHFPAVKKPSRKYPTIIILQKKAPASSHAFKAKEDGKEEGKSKQISTPRFTMTKLISSVVVVHMGFQTEDQLLEAASGGQGNLIEQMVGRNSFSKSAIKEALTRARKERDNVQNNRELYSLEKFNEKHANCEKALTVLAKKLTFDLPDNPRTVVPHYSSPNSVQSHPFALPAKDSKFSE